MTDCRHFFPSPARAGGGHRWCANCDTPECQHAEDVRTKHACHSGSHVTLLYRRPKHDTFNVGDTLMGVFVDIGAAVEYRDNWLDTHAPWQGDTPWLFHTVTKEVQGRKC